MKIQQIFFKNSLRNFSYIISFEDGAIFCIDPFSPFEIIEALRDKKLNAIVTTHDHCDHHSGNEQLVLAYNCPVMAHVDALVP